MLALEADTLPTELLPVRVVGALSNKPCHKKTSLGGLRPESTNWAVQPQKMVIGLKFRIKEVEGLYYLSVCSKNKGTDQLLGYSTLCNGSVPLFSHMQKADFLTRLKWFCLI